MLVGLPGSGVSCSPGWTSFMIAMKSSLSTSHSEGAVASEGALGLQFGVGGARPRIHLFISDEDRLTTRLGRNV
jgi:hypothetical protein